MIGIVTGPVSTNWDLWSTLGMADRELGHRSQFVETGPRNTNCNAFDHSLDWLGWYFKVVGTVWDQPLIVH